MELDEQQKSKCDMWLVKRLTDSNKHDSLSVVMQLKPDNAQNEAEELAAILPTMFPTRKKWRQKLIDRQQNRFAGAIAKLTALGLTVKGGPIIPWEIVEGTAGAIAEALLLEEVDWAKLDQQAFDVTSRS